jgi:hypothetical protein
MTNHLAQLRDAARLIDGRTIAENSALWLLKVGPWELHLEIPADPDYRPEPDEPVADCYVGAVVRLFHRNTRISTESCWGIAKDLGAGATTSHPFWEHLAEIIRELADEAIDPVRLSDTVADMRASLDAMAADVAALVEANHSGAAS